VAESTTTFPSHVASSRRSSKIALKSLEDRKMSKDGGAIEIQADNPNDAASGEAIQSHLAKVAEMFSQGDFNLPMLIHATVPPGVDTMKRLKNEIRYFTEMNKESARLRIRTENSEALEAIHEFLRFQITDHRTNDPMEVGG
jgi:hypothetical protein